MVRVAAAACVTVASHLDVEDHAAAVDAAAREHAEARLQGWPLEAIAARDLAAAAARRIEAKLAIEMPVEPIDADLWLRADGYSLLQALACLASRLRYELGVERLGLAARSAGGFARLELSWAGGPLPLDSWRSWEIQPLRLGGEASPFTLAEILRRHGAEAWQRYDAPAARGVIELALPLGEGGLAKMQSAHPGKPEWKWGKPQ
jgi:DNA polymerase-3 subunit epsilon